MIVVDDDGLASGCAASSSDDGSLDHGHGIYFSSIF